MKSFVEAHDVIEFWFGAPGGVQHGVSRAAWFKKSDAFDARIRERFLPLYQRALNHELAHWRTSPMSLLALIIVCDQFPRNMFRGLKQAFEADGMALDSARRMSAMHWDERLNAHERQFAYLPFEHAEQLDAQKTSMLHFGNLAREQGQVDLLKWARKHYVIIERFGRFPHRNAVLGRASTAEELAFLKQPDSAF